tara:strand:- start:594 stop:1016 length:423 start_codon:yes stop_codon:yes gene_type:complete
MAEPAKPDFRYVLLVYPGPQDDVEGLGADVGLEELVFAGSDLHRASDLLYVYEGKLDKIGLIVFGSASPASQTFYPDAYRVLVEAGYRGVTAVTQTDLTSPPEDWGIPVPIFVEELERRRTVTDTYAALHHEELPPIDQP